MKRSAVRARERREKDREDQRYNETLKEYVKFKYSHIIDEFGPFYEGLKGRYPKDMVYVNTDEFRRWRKNQIQISFGNVQVAYFDKVDLHGEKTSEEEEDSEQEQYEQQHSEQHGEQQQQSEQHGEQEQHEQQQSEQHDEQQHLEQQVEQHSEQHGIWQQQQQQIEQADDEINQIINELENGGVPLQNNNDDEGIHLDLYDELQYDIEEFDYRLEAELGDW